MVNSVHGGFLESKLFFSVSLHTSQLQHGAHCFSFTLASLCCNATDTACGLHDKTNFFGCFIVKGPVDFCVFSKVHLYVFALIMEYGSG